MVPLSGDARESGVKKLLKYSFHWDTCAELLLLLVLALQLIALKKNLYIYVSAKTSLTLGHAGGHARLI